MFNHSIILETLIESLPKNLGLFLPKLNKTQKFMNLKYTERYY